LMPTFVAMSPLYVNVVLVMPRIRNYRSMKAGQFPELNEVSIQSRVRQMYAITR